MKGARQIRVSGSKCPKSTFKGFKVLAIVVFARAFGPGRLETSGRWQIMAQTRALVFQMPRSHVVFPCRTLCCAGLRQLGELILSYREGKSHIDSSVSRGKYHVFSKHSLSLHDHIGAPSVRRVRRRALQHQTLPCTHVISQRHMLSRLKATPAFMLAEVVESICSSICSLLFPIYVDPNVPAHAAQSTHNTKSQSTQATRLTVTKQ